MTQTIPSSPINTRARSNFAARYVREHYLNRCCFECLVAEQEVRIEGTRVNTQANRHRPCDPISWNRNLMLAKCRENDSTMAIADFLFYYYWLKLYLGLGAFIFFFFFFSLLFFLHFTCCNFISFEDKSFHYGSRCFVTFVLVPYIYSYGYYSLWELSEDPRYRFVIFIADVYQGVCLEQSTNCEKNIWKFFWIVVSSYSFWIS